MMYRNHAKTKHHFTQPVSEVVLVIFARVPPSLMLLYDYGIFTFETSSQAPYRTEGTDKSTYLTAISTRSSSKSRRNHPTAPSSVALCNNTTRTTGIPRDAGRVSQRTCEKIQVCYASGTKQHQVAPISTKLHQAAPITQIAQKCTKSHQAAPISPSSTKLHQGSHNCTNLHQTAPRSNKMHQVAPNCTKLHQAAPLSEFGVPAVKLLVTGNESG